jgi:hypothetical protein
MFECIYENLPGHPKWEGTFYERLVEYGEWNISAFWQLHLALIQAAKVEPQLGLIDRTLASSIFRIYSRVSGLIACHFDQNDSFNITNLSYDEIHEYKERLELAVAGFFSGEVIPESSFDLKNPMIKDA